MSPTTTNESDDVMLSRDLSDSPPFDEESSKVVGGGTVLKKGPWTAAEDAILIDYVKKHGEGNWNAVQKHSGLFRCGKSCRLRWANHLRPNLKKGAFTRDEEQLIVELHAKMGNKWARMAAHVSFYSHFSFFKYLLIFYFIYRLVIFTVLSWARETYISFCHCRLYLY